MTLGVLFLFSNSWAQPYRDNLVLPSLEINQNLLNHARGGEFTKIERILPLIKPMMDTFQAKYRADVESELHISLDTHDPVKVLKAIQHFIYFDIKDLMSLAVEQIETSPQKATVKMREAYLNYLLLSSFIETANFSSDQKIKKNFRQVILALDSSAPYSAEGDISARIAETHQEIKRLAVTIDKMLAEALTVAK